eukprot:CAMPEP_0117000444 /NCGR_PEP_ID=MMETSP0472-20121206/2778_1 /TAXON_ID=693140 ORGANISM="Tiarina fusus, Strain LIS" /NCGR_SAMPLE_ID=MMETSP0472 /ASSEMBLY_ACC=CAM_ASM_000603 /LENGTH=82 /DNA_ID=CAMNT_0004700127 /DNA_START=1772 /DNA_END=2017 /DNA_ORIENTATION=+
MYYEKLQENPNSSPSQYHQLLAYHWYEAVQGQEDIDEATLDKVLELMRQSADFASQLLAIDDAASILQRALHLVEQVTLPTK